jgi:heme/copper-type cytochrome/quinol oxidase subunit 1
MKHKAHIYFWITALLIALTGLVVCLTGSDENIVINVGDTYYVTPAMYFWLFTVFIYFMAGVCYWVFYRLNILLNRKLTKIHTVLTILGLPACLFLNLYIEYKSREPFYILLDRYELLKNVLIALVLILLLVQVLLPINIIISLVKRKKHNPV